MRLALCGGGTGGHVYPALSIAAALERELPPREKLEPVYLGSQEGAEATLVRGADIPLRPVSSGPIRGRNPWELARNTVRMTTGVAQARRALAELGTEVVLSTGGYTSFPVALAARSRRVPIVLYLPDLYPGWSVRANGNWARPILNRIPLAPRVP